MTDETISKIIIDDEEGKVTEATVLDADGSDEDDAPRPPREITFIRPGDEDWLLDNVIGLANMGIEIGITLTVGGGLVSGLLVGGGEWIKLFADQFQQGVGRGNLPDLADTLANSFRQYSEIYEGKKSLSPQATFIHLKNAHHFIAGTPIPSGPGVLWRGRLSEVAGFSLGNLEVSRS